jgi:D-alanine-D-alanine ligase
VKICVLQPDYSTSTVDYRHYDPPRDLAPLAPGHSVHHEFLHKLTTYKQLQALKPQGFDIYVNLCEGYLEWDVPSVDVIHALEQLGLPYTGPTPQLFDPSKPLMKYVAHSAGIATPRHVVLAPGDAAVAAVSRAKLKYPLFVKPAKAGDSLGVDESARVADAEALRAQVARIQPEYPDLLVEEFIEGREFTVLVIGDPEGHGRSIALTPVEYRFPEGRSYKSYALKTSELHPDANVPVREEPLVSQLKDAARTVFRSFDATGYARMDFRMDAAGTLYFLEINFTCSVFYPEGWEGSADHILRLDGLGQAGFLERIVAEGRARHARKRKAYAMRGDAIAGYGIVATRDLAAGEVIFRGEERPFRLVTRRHVEAHWGATEQELFRRYAYPLSAEVYAIWDSEPTAWAPQNHSCEPNTMYLGLDVVAARAVRAGEELTLDYAQFLDTAAEPFECACGAARCRGLVTGTAGNSVTAREAAARSPLSA